MPEDRNGPDERAHEYDDARPGRLSGGAVPPRRGLGRAARSSSLSAQERERVVAAVEPAIRAATQSLAPYVDAFARQYLPQMRRVQQALAVSVAPTISALSQALGPVLEAYERAAPPNWPEHTLIKWGDLVDLAELEGLPVAWVPPADVLLELLAAPDAGARRVLLLARRDQLAGDCRRVLAQVADPGLSFAATCLDEAAEGVGAGRWRSAQSLATVVLTTLIHEHLGYAKLAEAREAFRTWLDDAALSELRLAVTVVALHPTLAGFWPGAGDPVPSEFNRHASTHALSPAQYTEGHALLVVLLATSLVRQLQELAEVERGARVAAAGTAPGDRVAPESR